jgi:hypothetical protein
VLIDKLIAMMPDLWEAIREPRSKGSEPSAGGKPKSKPPLDIDALDLHDQCVAEISLHQTFDETMQHVLCDVPKLIERVERFLGHTSRMVLLQGTVCHICGGQLTVAVDASTAVMCLSEGCGNVYKQEHWVEILYSRCDAT